MRKFDEASERLGYKNRSTAMQTAMQSFVTESKWLCTKMGWGVGAIILLYNHREKDVENALIEMEHKYIGIASSSMHVHLDEDNCLKIIPVRGSSSNIKALAQDLMTIGGVKELKLTMVTP